MKTDQLLLDALVKRLSTERDCHTIILYGSRARGDAISSSDYDVMAFHDEESFITRETGDWHGASMDIFFYSTQRMTAPEPAFIRAKDGRILIERDSLGRRFLATLRRLYADGPAPLKPHEAALRRNWALKMLERARNSDVTGNYRRVALLTELLESYFVLRDRWYLGPNEGFEQLKASDPQTYTSFQSALSPNAQLEDLEILVERVNNTAH